MRSLFNFIIKPVDGRYENTDENGIILNVELQNHEYVSRRGVVVATPTSIKTGIKAGDEVLVHFNVFRRMYDMRGNEKDSKSYFDDEHFFAFPDQIYMYKRKGEWTPICGYCFVRPISPRDNTSINEEEPLVGVVHYPDCEMRANGIKRGSIIGFTPNSEFTFIIDGEKYYRVRTKDVCILYGEHDFKRTA